MILEIYEYLLTTYGTELAVSTTKGFPDWARPVLAPPLVALELAGLQPREGRIGQAVAKRAVGYRGWLFARNEPELCHLLDDLDTWHSGDGSAFEIAARRVVCKLQDVQRHDPLTSAEKEGHAVVFVVEVAY